MKKLLHIGCGKQGVEMLPPFDWVGEWRLVRVDIDPAVGPDIVASMTEMAEIDTDSIDVIFQSTISSISSFMKSLSLWVNSTEY